MKDTLTMRLYLTLPATKRNFLLVIASIYDPLGLISPLLMLKKILFQELRNDKKMWDESLGH